MKKVYFAGSITGGRDDAALYKHIVDYAASLGWTVLTEHIGLASLSADGENRTAQYIYERDMAWIQEADAIIAEVTTPSLGVGYEVAQAEILGKPLLRLFRPSSGRRLTAMISGNPQAMVREYATTQEVEAIVATFLRQLEV